MTRTELVSVIHYLNKVMPGCSLYMNMSHQFSFEGNILSEFEAATKAHELLIEFKDKIRKEYIEPTDDKLLDLAKAISRARKGLFEFGKQELPNLGPDFDVRFESDQNRWIVTRKDKTAHPEDN